MTIKFVYELKKKQQKPPKHHSRQICLLYVQDVIKD